MRRPSRARRCWARRAAHLQANTVYTWNNFTGGVATEWATVGAWTPLTGYPGSDATTPTLDDIANFTKTGASTGGIITINVDPSNPIAAGSVGAVTLSFASTGTNSDGVTLNLNTNFTTVVNATDTNPSSGNFTVIGGTSNSTLGKQGTTTVNVAANTTLTVGGTMKLSGADSLGTAALNINGNYTAAGTQINDDLDNIRVNAIAGTVNLGLLSLGRSNNNASLTANLTALGGLHLYGGNVTATSFLVGSNNSGAVVEEAGKT